MTYPFLTSLPRKISLLAGAVMTAALWSGTAPSAQACGFTEVMSGICPAETLVETENIHGSGDRAAFEAKLSWARYAEFRNLPRTHDFVLNVCLFRKGAATVFTGAPTPISLEADPKLFETVGNNIEKAASHWSAITGQNLTGKKMVSRVSFNFRTSQGKIRACEDGGNDHILVTLNQGGTHLSSVGWKTRDQALAGARKATMTLHMKPSGGIHTGTVRHEFGHALGFLHEMGHHRWLDCAMAFNAPLYAKEQGHTFGAPPPDGIVTPAKALELTELAITQQAMAYDPLKKYSDDFDPKSLMSYPVPKRYFDPARVPEGTDCRLNGASETSKEDRKLFLDLYGRPA